MHNGTGPILGPDDKLYILIGDTCTKKGARFALSRREDPAPEPRWLDPRRHPFARSRRVDPRQSHRRMAFDPFNGNMGH